MICGSLKGCPIYTDDSTLFSGKVHIYIENQDIEALEALSRDNANYERLLIRDDNMIGYMATNKGTVYFGNESLLYTLMGREEDVQPIGLFYTVADKGMNLLSNLYSTKPMQLDGICGAQLAGKTIRPIKYYVDTQEYAFADETIQVSGLPLPAKLLQDYYVDLLTHLQFVGQRPKSVISTHYGFYYRQIGKSVYVKWN